MAKVQKQTPRVSVKNLGFHIVSLHLGKGWVSVPFDRIAKLFSSEVGQTVCERGICLKTYENTALLICV